ncbi:1-acylglycerol-3-phosphate O-acyltransferase [Polyrhizophydium stewartii]|uniref:1-acyl-sn-glycerol-3-phosphate acyltransferase n=1 Tax=Polyrhizophydium stewartii TaxID=2732419 RepID=A0ABR4NHV9_9FUNG
MQLATTVSLFAAGFIGRLVFLRSHKFRFVVRMVLFYVCIAVASLAGCIAAPIFFLLGRGGLSNRLVAAIFYATASRLTGTTVEVEGREHLERSRPCVFLVNHQSTLDMLTMGAVFPSNTAILAKAEIKWYPFMGQFMMLAKNVFINRGNRQSAIDTMARVARLLKSQNLGLWMYPEGTRSHQKDKTLLPFKKGAFHLATQGNMPLIPIVCSTYYPCFSESQMIFEPSTIRIKVLPQIDTRGMSTHDVDKLIEIAQEQMTATLKQLDTVPKDPSSMPKLKSE